MNGRYEKGKSASRIDKPKKKKRKKKKRWRLGGEIRTDIERYKEIQGGERDTRTDENKTTEEKDEERGRESEK